MFGGKLTRMTSGFKSAGELEMEKEKKRKELENQPVPLEWKVEKFEKEFNKQQDKYMEHLERTVQRERLNKLRKTTPISSTNVEPPPPPRPSKALFSENSTAVEFDLPNLSGNPWENVTHKIDKTQS